MLLYVLNCILVKMYLLGIESTLLCICEDQTILSAHTSIWSWSQIIEFRSQISIFSNQNYRYPFLNQFFTLMPYAIPCRGSGFGNYIKVTFEFIDAQWTKATVLRVD